MPCGKKRKRHKIATHKRKKRLRKTGTRRRTGRSIYSAGLRHKPKEMDHLHFESHTPFKKKYLFQFNKLELEPVSATLEPKNILIAGF
ncbi:MAG: hypothetical protein IPL42_10730 [Saprospiraceae bacterium]|nr:hypothetical protein [Saprospiraceae bacterium]